MARIDDDNLSRRRLGRKHGRRWRRDSHALRRGVFSLHIGGPTRSLVEFRLGRGKEIDDDAIAKTILRRQHERIADTDRLIEVDDEARIAGPEQTIAIALHRAIA